MLSILGMVLRRQRKSGILRFPDFAISRFGEAEHAGLRTQCCLRVRMSDFDAAPVSRTINTIELIPSGFKVDPPRSPGDFRGSQLDPRGSGGDLVVIPGGSRGDLGAKLFRFHGWAEKRESVFL